MLLSVCAGGGEVHGCTAYLFMKQGYPSTRMKISMPNDCSSSALHFINCSCQKLSHVIYLYRNILVALRIIKDAVHKCRCIYSEDSNKSVTIEFRSCTISALEAGSNACVHILLAVLLFFFYCKLLQKTPRVEMKLSAALCKMACTVPSSETDY